MIMSFSVLPGENVLFVFVSFPAFQVSLTSPEQKKSVIDACVGSVTW